MNSITTWRVHVAVPDSGHESDRMVEAATREDAIRQMTDLGYKVSSAEAVATREVSPPRHRQRAPGIDWRTILLLVLSMGCLGLGVLTFVSLRQACVTMAEVGGRFGGALRCSGRAADGSAINQAGRY